MFSRGPFQSECKTVVVHRNKTEGAAIWSMLALASWKRRIIPARAGSDRMAATNASLHDLFQSTLPRGERPPAPLASGRRDTVSIHAPARGATFGMVATDSICTGFNPRSRAGSDEANPAICSDSDDVSIHAPARGATLTDSTATARLAYVSIHAPARGATMRSASDGHHAPCFNPRSRAGSDSNLALERQHIVNVSIHAPARGATRPILLNCQRTVNRRRCANVVLRIVRDAQNFDINKLTLFDVTVILDCERCWICAAAYGSHSSKREAARRDR